VRIAGEYVWVKITTGREPIVDLDGRMRRQYKVSVFTQRWSDGREGGVTSVPNGPGRLGRMEARPGLQKFFRI